MSVLMPYLDDTNSLIGMRELVDPVHNRSIDLYRRIGFDRIIVSSEVIRVDWSRFDNVLKKEETEKKHTLYAYDCRKKEKILKICEEEDWRHWYSRIQVCLASNRLTLSKCNLPGCRDICRFEICIPPLPGHEVLGNIHNLTCKQEQERVFNMMAEVEQYGIYLNKEIANIKEVELNVNIYLGAHNRDFKDAIEIIRPHRQGLTGFKDSDYAEQDNKRKPVVKGYMPKTGYPWAENVDIPKRNKTSFNSVSKSRTVKVYDKAAETITKSKGKLSFVSPVTRVEFVITDAKEVPVYFNRKENLFEMTQDDAEDAFHLLASRLLKKPLDAYYRVWNRALEIYFERIDIYKHAWRKNVVMDIDKFVKESDGFLIIPIKELSRYVSLIPAKSVKKNRARITRTLQSEFRDRAASIRITESDTYNELMDWLCSLKGEEEQNILYSFSE